MRLLRVLHPDPHYALTAREVTLRFHGLAADDTFTAAQLRGVQRYLKALSEGAANVDKPALAMPALIGVIQEGGPSFRYFLQETSVNKWFMTETMALQLLLATQVMHLSLAGLEQVAPAGDEELARQVMGAASASIQRLRDRVRVVPDGIGRLPARILPEVLKAAFGAIRNERQIRLSYVNSIGGRSTPKLTALALVSKDGTIYLVGTRELNDTPRHYALHRAFKAELCPDRAQTRRDFNIDRYIDETHQFSHPLPSGSRSNPDDATRTQFVDPLLLPSASRRIDVDAIRMRVAPRALHQFKERPLARNQRIDHAPGRDGEGDDRDVNSWSVLTVLVPETVLLVPFLLSLGPWIRVDEPHRLVDQMEEACDRMAALYRRRALSGRSETYFAEE